MIIEWNVIYCDSMETTSAVQHLTVHAEVWHEAVRKAEVETRKMFKHPFIIEVSSRSPYLDRV